MRPVGPPIERPKTTGSLQACGAEGSGPEPPALQPAEGRGDQAEDWARLTRLSGEAGVSSRFSLVQVFNLFDACVNFFPAPANETGATLWIASNRRRPPLRTRGLDSGFRSLTILLASTVRHRFWWDLSCCVPRRQARSRPVGLTFLTPPVETRSTVSTGPSRRATGLGVSSLLGAA